jgi:hypothetical protein
MPRLAAEWGADAPVVLFVAAVMEKAGRDTPVTEPEASELFRAAEGAVLERLVARGQLTREMPRKVRRIRMSAYSGHGRAYGLRDLAMFASIRGFRQGVQAVTLLAALGVVDPQGADLLIEDNGDGWEVLGLAGGLSTRLSAYSEAWHRLWAACGPQGSGAIIPYHRRAFADDHPDLIEDVADEL